MEQQVQGAQVVGRVGKVLRAVSARAVEGITTTEAARATSLTRPTAHRLLASLAAEGFVDHDGQSGRWFLGPELFLMGAVAADRYDIADIARDAVRLLAAQTGESAFLSARRGDETVCLIREEGSFPVRSFVLHEGIRFPLGVASAGLAILAFLPPPEVDAYLDRDPALERRWGPQHSVASIRGRLENTRTVGYSLNPGLILEGSWGMGAAIFDHAGRPAWALSLTGIESRFRPERQLELGAWLLEQAHRVTKKLQQGAENPRGRR